MELTVEESRIKKMDNYKGTNEQEFILAKRLRIQELIKICSFIKKKELIKINGRVMEIRKLRKESYVLIKDFGSIMQLHIPEIINCDFLNCIDSGDWIEIVGILYNKNKSYTVDVNAYRLVAKCRFIFPKQLTDKRKRYNNRFLDFTINNKSLNIARCNSLINRVIRETLWEKGFEEYATPVLFTSFNGGVSKPCVTHVNALDKLGYLKVTSEIYLKQLIAAGFDSVFEISSSFRNDGIDKYHIPGFPLLEVYKAFANAEDMLNLNLEIIENILIEYNGEPYIQKNDTSKIRVQKEDWIKVNAYEKIREKTGIDILIDIKELRIQARKVGVGCSDNSGPATVIGNLIDKFIRQETVYPTIITHLPASMTPLMKKSMNKQFAERYWLFLNGIDISDIGSEQINYEDQKEQLIKQFGMMHDAYPHISINQDLLKAVSYGMPETGGIGFSLSRLLMAIENLDDVRETPIFPY